MNRIMYLFLLSLLPGFVHAAALSDAELPPLFDGIDFISSAVAESTELPESSESLWITREITRGKRQRTPKALTSSSSSDEVKEKCSICNRRFSSRGNLKRHLKLHTEEKPQCPSCNQRLADKSSLKRHIRSMHEGIRYHCRLCNKSFTHMSDVNRHVRELHEGEKHQCPSCNTYFGPKRKLYAHIRDKHPEIADSRKRQRGNR